jgi:hypothetical protein
MLTILCLLILWSASMPCSLHTFQARAGVSSQISGPNAYDRLTDALLRLPGVRLIERDEHAVLMSVLPVPSSMERGLGLFVVVRRQDNEVQLLGSSRLPLPTTNVFGALRQLEREARMNCGPPPSR